MDSFFIVAHRGGKGPYRENTLEALKHGLEQCGNAVEMDVRFDHLRKRFYLEHDFVHSPARNSNTIDKVIPFLPEKATLFVELKTLYFIRKRYSKRFLKVIEQFALDKRAIIMSFNPFILLQLKRMAPHLQIGFLIRNSFWAKMVMRWLYNILRPQYLMIHRRFFKKEKTLNALLKFSHDHRLKILTFTVNSPEDWYNALEHKFDGVITDYPREACTIMNNRKKVH